MDGGARMSNPVFGWVKEHPAIAATTVGGIGVLVWLLSRSGTGSTSDASTVANSQLQQASLANQNAATQAAAQATENQDALAAQVQNNTLAAELAATVSNNNVSSQTAQLAAQVQENTTNQQADVANNTVNAELTAQQTQVAAESQGLTTEFNYLTQVNQNQTALSTSVLNTVSSGGKQGGIFYGQSATTDEALLSALSLAQGGSSTVSSAESALMGGQVSSNYSNASIVTSLISGISSVFSGLFA
jgi:hypothetical protein